VHIYLFDLTTHKKVLTSRAKRDHICFEPFRRRSIMNERASNLDRGPTRSQTVDCKAMRELKTNARRGFLKYISDYALHAPSSIF
jgi:hypothetical protein